jgi:RHS repeat-associated protein
MIALLQRAWTTYLAIPRGSIYTIRNATRHVVTELTSAPGGVSGPSTYPIPTGPGRENMFFGSLLVASDVLSTLSGSLGWNWYHSDHLGSPRIVTNSSKQSIETWKYWPYGDPTTSSTTMQRLRFASMEADSPEAPGNYYAQARTYNTNLGRFTTPDPAQGFTLWPKGLTRYAYVQNNPVLLTDPTGLGECPPGHVCETVDVNGIPDIWLALLFGGGGGPDGPFPLQFPAGPPPGRRSITKHFSHGTFQCKQSAAAIMANLRNDFPRFGNYDGAFGSLFGTRQATVTFGSIPVQRDATIPISFSSPVWNAFSGATFDLHLAPTVTVSTVNAGMFSFEANPGHVLYPATISFAGRDTGEGYIGFTIVVNADFAGGLETVAFYAGGRNLESQIWNNVISNVQEACQ